MITVEIKGLEKLQQFQNWEPILSRWLTYAEDYNLRLLLKNEASRRTWSQFKNPTGALDSHFATDIWLTTLPLISGVLTNDSPYAFRRNYGFSGMTDSIGRFYPNDPGILFMEKALKAKKVEIKQMFQWAVSQALHELSGGAA